MLIKKLTQAIQNGLILNQKSNDLDNTYSCDYINKINDINNSNLKLTDDIIINVKPEAGSNYDPYGNSYYYKIGTRVHVHIGIGDLGSGLKNIFTLPKGYRPKTRVVFFGQGENILIFSEVVVDSDGLIRAKSSGNDYVLADFEFDAFN